MKLGFKQILLIPSLMLIFFNDGIANVKENNLLTDFSKGFLGIYSADCKNKSKPIVTLTMESIKIQTNNNLFTSDSIDSMINYFGQRDPGKEFQTAFFGGISNDVFVAFLVYEDDSGVYGIFDGEENLIKIIGIDSMNMKYYRCSVE